MEKPTLEEATENLSRQNPDWEVFLEGFKDMREQEFSALSEFNYGTSRDPRDYWQIMGKMLAYQDIYSQLKSVTASQ
jgi:hypothetical protein